MRKGKPITIGIDLGGTKVKMGMLGDDNSILFPRRYVTNLQKGPEGIIADITACVKDYLRKTSRPAAALGIGVAGQVEPVTGNIRFAPNLGWQDVFLKRELEKGIGLPVVVTNDVRAATYGEWIYGAGRGINDLVCIFVGTGIGGGIVSGGCMLEGCSNTAGELGHITIVAGGRRCHCSNLGCLEAYAGGWAIAERAKEAIKDDLIAGRHMIKLAGVIENVTAATVSKAYKKKDPLASHLVEETGKYLTAGIVSAVNALNPCMIILGGGVIEKSAALLSIIKQGVRNHGLEAAVGALKIVRAKLGDNAAVVGAAVLARNMAAEG